jgi:uncharacterized RDD family membrane protein YckC
LESCLEVIELAVKCPKCGFVSYPGITQCKKCGHQFVAVDANLERSKPPSILSLSSEAPKAPPRAASPPPAAPANAAPAGPPVVDSVPTSEPAPPAPAWRDELSGRVEDFRRKRARMRGNFDPTTTPDLDFGPDTEEPSAEVVDAEVVQPFRNLSDLDATLQGSEDDHLLLDAVPLEKPAEGLRVLSSAAVEAGDTPLVRPENEAEPVEIILESSPASVASPGSHAAPGVLSVAPLGSRFVAGLADALVLFAGGGLFALIFWAAGGHVTVGALNIVVFGAIAALFVLAYFGMFTALSSSTPGLLWMNLEVRSLNGDSPTAQESFWRAFGYLVSIASLLLGFVWALVDGDHLTWHDHMSSTFITPIAG